MIFMITIFFTLSLVIVVSFGVNQNLNQEEYHQKSSLNKLNLLEQQTVFGFTLEDFDLIIT